MDRDLKIALVSGLPGVIIAAILALVVAYITHSFNQREQIATEHRVARQQLNADHASKIAEFTTLVSDMQQTLSRGDISDFTQKAKVYSANIHEHRFDEALNLRPFAVGEDADFNTLVDIVTEGVNGFLGFCSGDKIIKDLDRQSMCLYGPRIYLGPGLEALSSALRSRFKNNGSDSQ
jgi:hypothetical protein